MLFLLLPGPSPLLMLLQTPLCGSAFKKKIFLFKWSMCFRYISVSRYRVLLLSLLYCTEETMSLNILKTFPLLSRYCHHHNPHHRHHRIHRNLSHFQPTLRSLIKVKRKLCPGLQTKYATVLKYEFRKTYPFKRTPTGCVVRLSCCLSTVAAWFVPLCLFEGAGSGGFFLIHASGDAWLLEWVSAWWFPSKL